MVFPSGCQQKRPMGDGLYEARTNLPQGRTGAREFLSLSKTQAIRVVVAYRNHLFEQGLAPATINRRISAIKSLVEMGQIFGICDYDLEVIKNEKVRPVRDTKGIDVPEVMRAI